jgi:dTDP-4-amino-4,6-dideoxygalactose transaminase
MDIVYSSKITDEWADKIVSLPIHPFLTTEEVDLIINSVNNF